MPRSIVEYFGLQTGNHCGYCKTEAYDKFSHGMWAHQLTCEDYQNLIDRGWRRSGKYCYKPKMDSTCCPMYTIRCNALDVKLSASQKKVLKRFRRYICDGVKETSTDDEEQTTSADNNDKASKKLSKTVQPGLGADPEKPAARKAKVIRREMQEAKRKASNAESPGASSSKHQPPSKQLEEFLKIPTMEKPPAHTFQTRLVRSSDPVSDQFTRTFAESFALYRRYQTTVHADPPERLTQSRFERFLCHCPLLSTTSISTRLVRVDRTETLFTGSFDESYSIYKRYQMTVHGDEDSDCDRAGFQRFLVDGPLVDPGAAEIGGGDDGNDELPSGYGAYHQQYLIDGKIVAVGVIDVLPNCVSSKYLYFDPNFGFLSLGTYSALREIALVRQLSAVTNQQLKYYYMGFYIHSCPKMRYKGNYFPSFLLCPETYHWYPIEDCIPKLEKNKYCRFAPSTTPDATLSGGALRQLVDGTMVLHDRTALPFSIYRQLMTDADKRTENEKQLAEYAQLIGAPSVGTILLYRE